MTKKLLLTCALALTAANAYADTPEISITSLQPRKLLYAPGEAASIDAVVANKSARDVTVTLSANLLRDFTSAGVLKPVTATVKAGETKTLEFPFTAGKDQYGYAVSGVLKEGGAVLDARTDAFNVSDNVFKVGIGAAIGMQQPSGYAWLKPEDDLKTARQHYMNMWEKFFWAPCDWADMTPKTAEWVSGQTGRFEVGAKISGLIKLFKENGIKSITYDTHVASGPPGWEVARKHPDWFYLDQLGRPAGEWHQNDLLHWNDPIEYTKKYGNDSSKWPYQFHIPAYKWMVLYPDYSRMDVIDFGSDRILDGADMWGWDGVRFDGHWVAGNDDMTTRNIQEMKKRIWAKYPNFLFGYNDNNPGHDAKFAASHEFRERMAGYGESMNEMIRGWQGRANDAPFTYTKWADYAEGMIKDVVANRKAQGTQYVILDSRKTYYKFMLATAAGAHTCYGDHVEATGAANWGKFLTRWSGLVYDVNLKQVEPKGKIGVKAEGKLWWDNYVTERVASATRFQRAVSLIVPPASEDIPKDDRGAPVSNVKVASKLTGAGKLTGVYLLDPEKGDDPVKLEPVIEGEWASVTVPQVTGWSLVVFDFAGTYTVPGNGPRMTEPFDPKKVQEALLQARRPMSKDPIRPEEDPTGAGSVIVREAEGMGLFVPGPTVVTDKLASGGAARRMDGETANSGSCFGHNAFSSLSPGRYRATYRILVEDKTKYTGMRLMYAYGKKQDFPLYVGNETVKQANVYTDYSYEFDYTSNQQLWISGFFQGNKLPGAMRIDKVTLELIKRFTDDDLEKQKAGLPLSEDLVPGTVNPDPGAAAGAKLVNHGLIVNGLYSDMYQLGAVFPKDWQIADAYTGNHEQQGPYISEFPVDPERVFENRVIVLSNVDANALGYDNRRLLKHYVEQGGGLLILGGMQTLGQGSYQGSFLEELLPVKVAPARDIQPAVKPLRLKAEAGEITKGLNEALWQQPANVYWRHRVELKPGAKVDVSAGTEPALVTGKFGKGRVAVFTGTVLGEKQAAAPPFWEWAGWPQLLGKTVNWLALGNSTHVSTVDWGTKIPVAAENASAYWLCDLEKGAYKDAEQKALDGDLKTAVRRTGDALGVPGAYLQYDLKTQHRLTQVRLASLADRPMLSPPDFKGWGQPSGPNIIRASNDGKKWTTLLTLPTIGETESADWHSFKIKSQETFRYVQLYGGNFMVSEMEVWGHEVGGILETPEL